MEQDDDIYQRVIRSIDDESEEVVIILSVEMLQMAGIEIGDPIRIVACQNELVIRKEQGREVMEGSRTQEGLGVRLYSKGELSVIFGVNITTINAWINENRFIGISHENHDQINELTLWACAAPGLITVRDVQEMYQQNQDRLRGGSHDEDRRKRRNH